MDDSIPSKPIPIGPLIAAPRGAAIQRNLGINPNFVKATL
jgi:hypothetical protein